MGITMNTAALLKTISVSMTALFLAGPDTADAQTAKQSGVALARPPGLESSDPLVAIDRNRESIITDIVQGFRAELAKAPKDSPGLDAATLRERLSKMRADRLLAASLASSYSSLKAILEESESIEGNAFAGVRQKVLGDANRSLVYTPLTPCRLVDTRGFGAPIQGGPFAPNTRRAYVPNGQCAIPLSGVATLLVSFTTQNLTPNSGGYLAILGPGAPITASVDVFNLGAEWSASNTAVATGTAGQFDVFVAAANAQVVVDILGYFSAAIGGGGAGTVTSVSTGTGLTGGPITSTGTISIANGGVGTAQISDGSVTYSKIASGGLPAAYFAFTSLNSTFLLSNFANTISSPNCPAGTAISGTCRATNNVVFLLESYSNVNGGWSCAYSNRGANTETIYAGALCLSTPAAPK